MILRSLSLTLLLGLSWSALLRGIEPPANPQPAAQAEAGLPFKLERFALPGPVAGVLARVDLADPRVKVQVVLADDRDPDGDGPCVGRLDTPSQAARKHDFALAINASFFAVAGQRKVGERSVPYFTGNGAFPEGWHLSDGKLVARPRKEAFRAVFIVDAAGRVSFLEDAKELPPTARYAVSGSSMVLRAGQAVARPGDAVRHPRSAVGLSADGRTLFIAAVDGRQDHSRGVTLEELGQLMKGFGAHQALNLDGGGSTSLVVKDPASGVYAIANQPSDTSIVFPGLRIERPVLDVIGVSVR